MTQNEAAIFLDTNDGTDWVPRTGQKVHVLLPYYTPRSSPNTVLFSVGGGFWTRTERCKESTAGLVMRRPRQPYFQILCSLGRRLFDYPRSSVKIVSTMKKLVNEAASRMGEDPSAKMVRVCVVGLFFSDRLCIYVKAPRFWADHSVLAHLFIQLLRVSVAVALHNEQNLRGGPPIECLEDIAKHGLCNKPTYSQQRADISSLVGVLKDPLLNRLFTPDYGKTLLLHSFSRQDNGLSTLRQSYRSKGARAELETRLGVDL